MSGGGIPAPRGCTCHRLRRTARRVTRLYDSHLAPSGLTLNQYSLLAVLAFAKAAPTLGELAALMGMDRTTLTRDLRPLLARGLIARQAGGDRRRRAMALTEPGRAAWEEARGLWRAAQDVIEERLGREITARLHELLDGAFAALE